MWPHFTKELDTLEHKTYTRCKFCNWIGVYNSSTGSMSYHLRNFHRDLFNNVNANREPVSLPPGYTSKQLKAAQNSIVKYTHTTNVYDKKTHTSHWKIFCRYLARFVISSNSPIPIVTNNELKDHVNFCCGEYSKFRFPSGYELKQNVLQPMVEETESVIKNELKKAKAFGITTDSWQSGTQDYYESYTTHWIKETADTFEIHSRVLGTIPNNAKHTGQNLKKSLDKEMF